MISSLWRKDLLFSWLTTMMKDEIFARTWVQHILYLQTSLSSLSWLQTMSFVMNSLTFPACRERRRAWLGYPFQVFLHCSSPAVFAGTEFAHITPAHLHKLKQGNVIYLLSLAVPFSWLSEITANINRGYKKGALNAWESGLRHESVY